MKHHTHRPISTELSLCPWSESLKHDLKSSLNPHHPCPKGLFRGVTCIEHVRARSEESGRSGHRLDTVSALLELDSNNEALVGGNWPPVHSLGAGRTGYLGQEVKGSIEQ